MTEADITSDADDLRVLFRRRPIVVGFSSELPREGDFVAREVAALPLLYARRKGHDLGAFVNVCKHRGTRLVVDACGRDRRAFVCPLHGWIYDLEGQLCGGAPDHGHPAFASADPARLALTKVPSAEAFGLVWSLLTPNATLDVRASLDPAVVAALDALDLPARRVHGARVEAKPVRWRRAVESALAHLDHHLPGPVHLVATNAFVAPRDGCAFVVSAVPTGAGGACKITTAALIDRDRDLSSFDAELAALAAADTERAEGPAVETFRAALLVEAGQS